MKCLNEQLNKIYTVDNINRCLPGEYNISGGGEGVACVKL